MSVAHYTKVMTLAVALAIPAPAAAQTAKAAPTQTTKTAPKQPAKAPAKAPAAKGSAPKASAPKAPAGRGTAAAPALTAAERAKLKDPAALKDVAPAEFRAAFDTSAGPFVVLVHRSWAPKGADRFYNLVKYGFFNNNRFFRVLPRFMAQFGINGEPDIAAAWENADITDDPVTQSNRRGTVSFATRGPNTRTTQLFINFVDNGRLDGMGFAPFGEVVSGMEAVDKINAEYREDPDQELLTKQGNAYLAKQFPRLDYVRRATIVRTPPPAAATKK